MDASAAASLPSLPLPPLEAPVDPIEQWLLWEEQANLVGFRVSTQPVAIQVALIPSEKLSFFVAGFTPPDVCARFLRGDRICFPRHPLNLSPNVAFLDEPVSEVWSARYTSSRTLAVADGLAVGGSLFSIKLPTDRPHRDFVQPEKVKLREEGEWAIELAGRIERVEAAVGKDPSLLLVKEALVALVPGGETGFMVRDLTPLQDGCYYLPALSIPYCGRQIAARHRSGFDAFWGRAYARAVGRAKALLAARYGLQYETPNPQNILLQLDAALRPTGVVVFRDLGDTDALTQGGSPAAPVWGRLARELKPETRNSFWAFDSADDLRIAPEILDGWYALHDRAYLDALLEFFDRDGLTIRIGDIRRLKSAPAGEKRKAPQ